MSHNQKSALPTEHASLAMARRSGVFQLSARELMAPPTATEEVDALTTTTTTTLATILRQLGQREHPVHAIELYHVGLVEDDSLCAYVASHPELTRLKLVGTSGIVATRQLFRHGLCHHPSLVRLGLLWNSDHERDIVHLLQQNNNPSLRSLDLTVSVTTSSGMQLVAQALRGNDTLQELTLDYCRLTDDSFGRVLDAISSEGCRVQTLSVNGNNQLSEQSLHYALLSTKRCSSTLQSLSCERIDFLTNEQGWQSVAQFLVNETKDTTTLRSLLFGTCHVTNQGLEAIFQSLEKNNFLESFNITCTATSAFLRLLKSLPNMKTLQKLSLETQTMPVMN